MQGKYRRGLLAVAIAAVSSFVPANASYAADSSNHCVLVITGLDKTNHYTTEPMVCYESAVAARTFATARTVSNSVLSAASGGFTTLSDTYIAVHYEHSAGGGGSLSIIGSVCNGGGLNLPAIWNDKISSTWSSCTLTTHYEDINYSGTTAGTTAGLRNIFGYMNDKTSSVIYS